MASTSSVSGLSSGIQWQDLIDQLMAADSARQLDPITAQVKAQQQRSAAWSQYGTVVAKLTSAAKALSDGSAFGAFKTTVGASATSGRTLFNATASTTAAPGSYKVQVLGLASAEKLSGNVVASATGALGIAGSFAINGQKVDVAAGDSLSAVRDRINALNTGTNATRVSATLLSTGGGASRLVLTSETAGAAGISLTDGDTHPLQALGFLDGTTVANRTADGGSETQRFSSAEVAVAAALGATTSSPPATIKVGNTTIDVDLGTDSLSAIAAKIRAAGVTANVVTETVDGRTSSRLQVGATVSTAAADPADTADQAARKAAGARSLELLGFTVGGRGAVSQVLAGEGALSDANGTASGASLLTDLQLNGASAGIAAGDTITIRGTQGDGKAVSTALTVGASDSVDTLLQRINAAFSASGRAATASIGGDGRLRLTDGTGGDSQLSLSLAVDKADGTATSLGRMAVETTGRLREVTAGSDARLTIDGVLMTRTTNTVSDALPGVTLNLQGAEAGTTIDLAVARDQDAIVGAVKNFASAYNAVRSFVTAATAQGGALASSGALRGSLATLTSVMLTNVDGLTSSTWNRGVIAGLAIQKDGTLALDEATFKGALATNFADVSALFGTAGRTSTADLEYVTAGAKVAAGAHAVAITAPATQAARDGSGFGGAYAVSGPADTLRVTDKSTGRVVAVSLADGQSMDTIAANLNTAFGTGGLALSATNANGQLRLSSSGFGSASGFTVAFEPGTAGNVDQLGITGTTTGTDVAGTIDGLAATGSGQLLTGAAGTAVDGFAVRYTGSATGAVGTATFALGIGGMMQRVAEAITRAGDGLAATQSTSLDDTVTGLNARAATVQSRLDARRAALVKQFTAMETIMNKLQAQGTWLTQQVNAMSASANSK